MFIAQVYLVVFFFFHTNNQHALNIFNQTFPDIFLKKKKYKITTNNNLIKFDKIPFEHMSRWDSSRPGLRLSGRSYYLFLISIWILVFFILLIRICPIKRRNRTGRRQPVDGRRQMQYHGMDADVRVFGVLRNRFHVPDQTIFGSHELQKVSSRRTRHEEKMHAARLY